jgi:hypothetical protein
VCAWRGAALLLIPANGVFIYWAMAMATMWSNNQLLAMGQRHWQWGNGNCVYVSLQEKTLCIKVTESLQNVCTASIHDFHPSNKTATIVVHNVPVFLP